jgi:hypothetical protein
MLSTFLMFVTLGTAPDTAPQALCAARTVSAAVETFVVHAPVKARDTVVTAVVCMKQRAPGSKIGSYHGELLFDSLTVRVLRVEKPAGGMRVENTTLKGQVNFAGADPSGFADGMLLRVDLRISRPGRVPVLRLRMRELNSTAGVSLLKAPAAPSR